MKKQIIFFITFVIHAHFAFSQAEPVISSAPISIVDQFPTFPGGEVELIKFLKQNIIYPMQEKNQEITGTVYISFIVDTSGNIINPKIERGVKNGPNLAREAIRVVKLMPKWNPGKTKNNNVEVKFTLPIRFTLNATGKTGYYDNSSLDVNSLNDSTTLIRNMLNSGVFKFKGLQYEEAIQDFSNAINLSQNSNIEALYYRVECYLKLHKYDLACIDLQQLKKLGNTDTDKMISNYCK